MAMLTIGKDVSQRENLIVQKYLGKFIILSDNK